MEEMIAFFNHHAGKKKLGMPLGKFRWVFQEAFALSRDEIKMLVREMDVDSDGYISLSEFTTYVGCHEELALVVTSDDSSPSSPPRHGHHVTICESDVVARDTKSKIRAGQKLVLWFERAYEKAPMHIRMDKAVKTLQWITVALKISHANDDIKKVLRRLFATKNFSHNVELLKIFDPLKTALKVHLQELGKPLEELYQRENLGELLASFHRSIPQHPCVLNAPHVSQLLMIPVDKEFFDFDDLVRIDEKVYLHVLIMVALAVDAWFRTLIVSIVGESVEVHAALPKAYARARTKMYDPHEYRDLPKPRTAYNLDMCRTLVVVNSASQLLEISKQIVAGFEGCAKVENLFSLSQEERARRYNQLSLLLSVPFLPAGCTFATLCASANAQRIFSDYMENPQNEPRERWFHHTRRARDYIQSPFLADKQVSLLCEVQLMLRDHYDVRRNLHEPLKASRAENGEQLYREFVQYLGKADDPEREKNDFFGECIDLYDACMVGQLSVAKRLVHGNALIDGNTPARSPILIASQNGHTEVVHWLLESGVQKRCATEGGTSPLYVAAEFGHTEIVSMLLARLTDDGKPNSCGNMPLHIASLKGYSDVATLLVKSGAGIDMLNNEDATALYLASLKGHLLVVRMLLKHGANINEATIKGATPLFAACANGHRDIVSLLLEQGAEKVCMTVEGATPISAASLGGHKAIVELPSQVT